MKKLYHFELGFPEGLRTSFGVVSLKYTNHAKRAASNDRYGKINLPKTIDTNGAKCIEAEVTNGVASKLVYRVGYDEDLDIVMVLRSNLVITVWFNKKSDKHKTLDASKYDTVA
jgi:hypothetical protein